MSAQESGERTRWRRAPELPPEVFAAWRKPSRGFNPISIVATLDPDGTPHTAPFGSLRAVTPRLLRLCSWRGHDTYKNLCRDERVTVAMLAPPNLAVSVRGRARVVREQMKSDEHYAVVDIDVEEVKNDMGRAFVIETALTISLRDEYRHWFEAALGELEEM
ncbi:MAG: hypothetical protein AMJ93_17150 [Anaerolineae bacterium SM23_84]|jgi:uncharacterized pyridoxamine 5'-phosphate oxidase family protein|nr:MAG: hypothetical protein AMJ93_17150 [Anaerolineae bacterium SM23_84]